MSLSLAMTMQTARTFGAPRGSSKRVRLGRRPDDDDGAQPPFPRQASDTGRGVSLRRSPAALAIVTCGLLAGCAKPEASIVGTWQIDPASVLTGDRHTDEITKSALQIATLHCEKDHTYTWSFSAGRYEVRGRHVTFTPTTDFDLSMGGKVRDAELSSDGKSMTTTSDAGKLLRLLKLD